MMTPATGTAIAEIVKNNPELLEQPKLVIQQAQSTVKTVFTLALLGAGIYFGYKAYKQYQKNKEEEQTGSDEHSNLAQQIYDEIKGLGTSDTVLLSLFSRVKDFQALSKSYRKISGNNILDDVRDDVSSSTYQKILNMIGVNTGAFKPSTQESLSVKKSKQFIITNGDVNLRKTPIIPSCGSGVPDQFCYKKNVIKTIPKGRLVGVSTEANFNRSFVDPKSGTNFIELRFTRKEGGSLVGYIAASHVITVQANDTNKQKVVTYPLVIISQSEYDNASAPLQGLGSTALSLI